jgi:hypothetical protein
MPSGPRYDPENPPPTRPSDVYAALNQRGVRYVTIGGVAVQAHGHTRTTADVDLLVEGSADNLAALGAALGDLGAELSGVDAHLLGIDVTDAKALRDGANFTLLTRAGPLDLWTDWRELPGSPPWEELDQRALTVHAAGVPIRVVSFDDLIRLKRAAAGLANRPERKREEDLDDIAALTAILEERRHEG